VSGSIGQKKKQYHVKDVFEVLETGRMFDHTLEQGQRFFTKGKCGHFLGNLVCCRAHFFGRVKQGADLEGEKKKLINKCALCFTRPWLKASCAETFLHPRSISLASDGPTISRRVSELTNSGTNYVP